MRMTPEQVAEALAKAKQTQRDHTVAECIHTAETILLKLITDLGFDRVDLGIVIAYLGRMYYLYLTDEATDPQQKHDWLSLITEPEE